MLRDSFFSAISLIFHGDKDLWQVVFLSLRCTFWACLGAILIGIPCALLLLNRTFFGKRFVLLLLSTLQALPTVIIGLFLYILLSGTGIFGSFKLLYSPTAITLGQFILILPLVTMMLLAALTRLDTRYRETALTLGATARQADMAVLREARFAIVATLCMAFGRGLAEIGVSMMLGGNIKGYTRTMTTAMALEYDKGEFVLSLALGFVLLLVSFMLNFSLGLLQGKMER